MPLSDPMVLGLTFQIAGIYFLAASIVFKRPRRVLEDLYGIKRGNLREIRETVYKKNRVIFGMFFLLAGYLLQTCGLVLKEKGGSPLFGRQTFVVLAFLVAMILAVSVVIHILGLIWTHRSFKRMLVRFVQDNPRVLQENRSLTKEMGELLGVSSHADVSFEEHLQQIRDHMNLGSAGGAGGGGLVLPRGSERRARPARTS